jgi:hypothetical protein
MNATSRRSLRIAETWSAGSPSINSIRTLGCCLPYARSRLDRKPDASEEKDADLDTPILGAAYGGNILCTGIDLPERVARPTHELLSSQREVDTAMVSMEERSSQVVHKIADSSANSRLTDLEVQRCFAKAAMLCCG